MSDAERFAQVVGEECVKRGFMLNVAVSGPELLDFVLDGFDAIATISARDERIRQLEAALRDVEWSAGEFSGECGWCYRVQEYGHSADCKLAALLGSPQEPPKPTGDDS